MNIKLLALLVTMLSTLLSASAAVLGTCFTYQGRLTDGGSPANGGYDLRLILYAADSGGNPVGNILTNANVAVNNGLFTTQLDFGANLFNGEPRWLEIAVRPGSSTSNFTPLSPRQALTPAPYALFATASTSTATANSVPWSGVTGVPAGLADGVDNDTTYTAGAGLTLSGTELSVNFGGNGSASTLSRSDHNHLGNLWIGNGGLGVWNTNSAGALGPPVSLNGFSLTGGTGVRGSSVSGTGVDGSSDSGYGVYGVVTTGTQNAGVYGKSTANNGAGVLGQADSGTSAYGVWGKSSGGKGVVGQSTSGTGVYGSTDGSGAAIAGVNGKSTSSSGTGVLGEADGSTAFGVWGRNTSGAGVHGNSNTGRAVDGLAVNGGVGVYGSNLGSNTKGYAGDFFGRVRVTGDLVLNSSSLDYGAIKVTGAGEGSSTPVFIHRATAANTSGVTTTIDHPLTNGDPNAILIVTPNVNPGGVLVSGDMRSVGVSYSAQTRKWEIRGESAHNVPRAFNVLVVKP